MARHVLVARVLVLVLMARHVIVARVLVARVLVLVAWHVLVAPVLVDKIMWLRVYDYWFVDIYCSLFGDTESESIVISAKRSLETGL